MSSRFVRSRLRHAGWWVFSLFIAGPAIVLAWQGMRASRTDWFEREQQLRDQQVQTAHLADAAIATAVERTAAQLDRLVPAAFDDRSPTPAASLEFPVFVLDQHGVLSFPSRRLYIAPVGEAPAFLNTRARFSASESQLIWEAQAMEAQNRRAEAIESYQQARKNPALKDWADLALDRLAPGVDLTSNVPPLANPRRAHSSARTPEGIPLAIVASSTIEHTDPRLRSAFVPLVEQTLNNLRRNVWWLSADQRLAYDSALRGWLELAGSSRVESSDSGLDELIRLGPVIRRASQQGITTPRLETEGRLDYLIIWSQTPHSAGAIAAVLSGSVLQTFLDEALRPVFKGQPFTAALVRRDGHSLWNGLGDGVQPWNDRPLHAVDGFRLDFTGPADALVTRHRWIGYGYVLPPVLLLAVGLAMTARLIRQEVALNERQAKFIAAVSHELKSPLTGIRLMMERLTGGRAHPAEAHEYYAAISRETDRLETLVNRLLESQAIQSHRRAYTFEPASLAALATASLQRLRHQADAKGIRVVAQMEAGLPEIPLDKAAIGDAIENLLDNAIKYSPPDTEVSVHIRATEDEARIEVSDRGMGVAPAEIPRIFDPFYRGRRGDVENVKGTGLGLALVKAAAEAHGGAVDVASGPHGGSTFTLRIPRVQRA